MSSKLSERLQALVGKRGERTALVKIRLRAGLSGKDLKNVVHRIESHLGRAEYLSISGTVHGELPLSQVAAVSDLPEVEWIDVERQVPIEELIDPKPLM